MKIDGRMKVKTLKSQFKSEFGLTLRVYDGRSFAADESTLASIRKGDAKGGEFSPRKNTKVGNFENKIIELFGIKNQIAGSDDSYLCDNDITLAKALVDDEAFLSRREKKKSKITENDNGDETDDGLEFDEAEATDEDEEPREGAFSFTDLNEVEEVVDTFEGIADKILERGFLVTLTGDLESEISIKCELLEDDGEKQPFLAIRIESEECKSIDKQGAESLADFIAEKIHDCFEEWPEDIVEEYIEMTNGEAVFLNGIRVY